MTYQYEHVVKLASIIRSNGGRLVLAGGFPRDMILQKLRGYQSDPKDFDCEVYGLQPEDLEIVLNEFGKPVYCGKSFGVYKMDNMDISLPRREVSIGPERKDFLIHIDPFISTEEACRRRDFTMNAMLLDPISGQMIDHYGGIQDMVANTIRMVSPRSFVEDSTRILRGIQFAARFGMRYDDTTVAAMRESSPLLDEQPMEKIYTEMEKLLLLAPKPSRGFNDMKAIGAMRLFPELDRLHGVEQDSRWHPEGDVWMHTMKAIDYFAPEERDMVLMLALLYHDVGKARDTRTHNEDGCEMVQEIFPRAWTTNSDIIDKVSSAVRYHLALMDQNVTKHTIRRLASKTDVPLLTRIYAADRFSRGGQFVNRTPEYVMETYNLIKNEVKPIMMGRHLIEMGLTPGPRFGKILKLLYEKQLSGEFSTVEEGKRIFEDQVAIAMQRSG